MDLIEEMNRLKNLLNLASEQEIIAETLYKSCQEAINSYKLQMKILQEQIEKEYHNEL